MKRLKKFLVALVLGLAIGGLAGMTGTAASASTWHKGLPKVLKQHRLWGSKRISRFGSAKQFYSRNFIETGYSKGSGYFFSDVMRTYYKNGKFEQSFVELLINSRRYEVDPATTYMKTGKHTYQIKSTVKQSGYPDQRYKVQQSGKHMTVWTKRLWNHIDPNKGFNRSQKKWHKIDHYQVLKNISDDNVQNKDPMHK